MNNEKEEKTFNYAASCTYKKSEMPFGYSAAVKQQEPATVKPVAEPTVMTIDPTQPRKNIVSENRTARKA